ncbi:MAG: hypothetical protein JXE07_05015 [Candidatus Aminicenantes bacterium]|nr:hypothetical protein [Candidatus Aminicenantes bacterium]
MIIPVSLRTEPLTGRLIVVVSRKDAPEPRLTISPHGPPIFGADVENLRPGETAVIDERAPGYPLKSLKDLPAGDYFVQAVMNVYTECRRSDGHTVWVHLDRSQGTPFNLSPGNFYSQVQNVHLAPQSGLVARLVLDQVIPAAAAPADTEWLKHVTIQSRLLTEFWNQPIFIEATVLLPKDYAAHPDVFYPVVYVFEHRVPFSFNPDPASQARDRGAGAAGLKTGYEIFQSWTSAGFPRFVAITLHQPTPFFPSSYSVNSANNGPYGDALFQEVFPYLEAQFRTIPKPYARLVEGASTGGWEALALQLYHPDYYGRAHQEERSPGGKHVRMELLEPGGPAPSPATSSSAPSTRLRPA